MFSSRIPFLLFFTSTLLCLGRTTFIVKCEYPRIPKGCGTSCPPTCENPNPVCVAVCVPENICACPAGYVERSITDRTCVKLEYCYQQFCKKPKQYASCASVCQPTCGNPKPAGCTRNCKADTCVCPSNMVQRSTSNTTCMYVKDCPGSCTKLCGAAYDKKRSCQCDSRCKEHDDCCEDYEDRCLMHNKSCNERCNSDYDGSRQCQCDDFCTKNGDCCDDYYDECQ